ncbi:MAG TPA: fatty acid desaturase [Rhodospirillaceae bacterium]|nr:fatty acid desaturase [Rhodospirillaceae bacterium]
MAGGGDALPIKEIERHCSSFKGADTWRSVFQLVTTLALFAVTLALMIYGMEISFWIPAALLLPAAGLLTRIFTLQHDCGHGSFFNSKTANDWTGRILAVLTVTPYDFWRRAHNKHHATSGDLDRRSIGGIDTITVREYQNMPKWQQRAYRIYRNPFVLLMFGTPFYVMVLQRLPFNQGTGFYPNYQTLSASSIWKSIMLTNLSIVVFFGVLGTLVGIGPLLAVYIPVLIVTSWIGGWLFYIQHQFEDTYWAENKDWDIHEAALLSSSYFELPKVLQWFTGNIGLHHIHHLCSGIPNYKLQACMDARPELKTINKLTLRESLKCPSLKLWDENLKKLVGFHQVESV